MNTKTNQRYKETEELILQVFVGLIAKRQLSHITIKEICERAEINRTSFYLHFKDMSDLMEKTEVYLTHTSGRLYDFVREEHGLKEKFDVYFEHIRKYRTFYKPYLTNGHELHFVDELMDLKSRSSERRSVREGSYSQAFFRAGISALVREWLEQGCEETSAGLSRLLFDKYVQGKPGASQ